MKQQAFAYFIKAGAHRELVVLFFSFFLTLDHTMRYTALPPADLYSIPPLYFFHHSALFANICNQSKALTL